VGLPLNNRRQIQLFPQAGLERLVKEFNNKIGRFFLR
jgi:hypothetical protein